MRPGFDLMKSSQLPPLFDVRLFFLPKLMHTATASASVASNVCLSRDFSNINSSIPATFSLDEFPFPVIDCLIRLGENSSTSRSEERRVGKECRSRRVRYRYGQRE